jgi:hypothetical protein
MAACAPRAKRTKTGIFHRFCRELAWKDFVDLRWLISGDNPRNENKDKAKGGLPERRWRRLGVGIAFAALLPLGSPAQAADPEEDGQWVMPGKNYAGHRFSGLDQINVDNANSLQVAWTFSVGVLRGQEAAPIVADNTMFVVTPYPNILYALDLTKPGGPLKWKFEPEPAAAAQGVACCDTVNRGAVYAGGKVFLDPAA